MVDFNRIYYPEKIPRWAPGHQKSGFQTFWGSHRPAPPGSWLDSGHPPLAETVQQTPGGGVPKKPLVPAGTPTPQEFQASFRSRSLGPQGDRQNWSAAFPSVSVQVRQHHVRRPFIAVHRPCVAFPPPQGHFQKAMDKIDDLRAQRDHKQDLLESLEQSASRLSAEFNSRMTKNIFESEEWRSVLQNIQERVAAHTSVGDIPAVCGAGRA